MPTHQLNQFRLSGVGFFTSQLMTNGKILAFEFFSGRCYIIEPNEYGSYRSPRVRRVQDLPFTQLYGPISIANNGDVIVHCGEYGTSHMGYTQIFNPETEKWTFYNEVIANHSLALMSPNGTVWGAKRLPPNALPTSGQTITYSSNNDPTAAMNLSPGYASSTEACHAMLPNGNAAIFEFSYPQQIPGNPAYVGQLTLDETTGSIFWGRSNLRTKMLNLPSRFREYSTVPGNDGRWCSTGDGPKGVVYEPGVLTYMARTNKLVLVSGNGGIFTMDVNSNGSFNIDSFARPAALPNTPNWSSTHNDGSIVDSKVSQTTYGGLVSGSSFGKTGQQIADTGILEFTARSGEDADTFRQMLRVPLLDSNYDTPAVFIRLKSNTEWVKFIYTGVTNVSNNSTLITLTGVSLAIWPGQVNWATSTNDQVCLGRPSYDSRDGCATFLPNGDLLFAAGAGTNGAEFFNTKCRLLKWNGVASVATNASDDTKSIIATAEYVGSLFPLPDGNIWCGFGIDSVIYEPTQDEAIPFANSIPIITSAPTSFAAGSRFSLAGNGLTGVHEGGYFSEDRSPRTNFPIVKLRNTVNNYVYYCVTRDFTYRGIKPGEFSSCNVHVPYTVPTGSYQMSVVVNAVSSAEMTVTVGGQAGGEPMFLNRKA